MLSSYSWLAKMDDCTAKRDPKQKGVGVGWLVGWSVTELSTLTTVCLIWHIVSLSQEKRKSAIMVQPGDPKSAPITALKQQQLVVLVFNVTFNCLLKSPLILGQDSFTKRSRAPSFIFKVFYFFLYPWLFTKFGQMHFFIILHTCLIV